MYRVAKKTTKRKAYTCLKCKHVKTDDYNIKPWGCMVECNAPNKCFNGEFNAKDYYCIEYKSLNEMTEREQEKFLEKKRKRENLQGYTLWAKKYHTKQEAKELIKKYKEVNNDK